MEKLAHYDINSGQGEPLKEHLLLVAKTASEFASAFSADSEAYAAGLLHDLGKYGDEFQRRLKGELRGVDHWSAGAWHALLHYELNGVASALAIQGHHLGLQEGNKDFLGKLNPEELKCKHPLGLTTSYAKLESLSEEGIDLPLKEEFASIYSWGVNNASAMLDVRMLFSALVDADFLETEAWFQRDQNGNRRYRNQGLSLQPDTALSALKEYVRELANTQDSSSSMQCLRDNLFSSCLEAGNYPQDIFTLTAPTGSGKTLAMLAFALTHAIKHNLRRIIVVLPYLTLIEQTTNVYRKVFEKFVNPEDMDRYLLEDHSLSGIRYTEGTHPDTENNLARLLTQNWDAPVIVTTNVQFMESLFSNRPSACRKLHNSAQSIILFDEVQTMPLSIVIPTLGTISRLVEKYGASVVFATATQPAFSHMDSQITKHCSLGWKPREIVPDMRRSFSIAKRTRTILSPAGEITTWESLAEDLAQERQALCIVNLKRHAKVLFEKLKSTGVAGVFHLSTNMCPAHRQNILSRVRYLLKEQQPCHLISTQCVEAGVDVDFPSVYRSFGPLDSIAQAAGRCNRNGRIKSGAVHIFHPQDDGYPDHAYEQATDVARAVLSGNDELDISDLDIFQRYYLDLYTVRGINRLDAEDDELLNAITRQDFAQVCQLYRIIPQDAINVLVPYEAKVFHQLREEVHAQGLTHQWILRARPYTVSLFRPRSPSDEIYLSLEPIPIRPNREEESTEWYIYRKEGDYDEETGLDPSLRGQAIIA